MPLRGRCDGHDDCGDGADEERCDILPENLKKGRLSRAPHVPPVSLVFNLVMIEDVSEDTLSLKVWLRVGNCL